MVCDKLGLPWLTINPTPFSIESKTDAPAFLGGLKPPLNWRQALRNRLGRGAVHGFKCLVYRLFVKKALKRFDPVISLSSIVKMAKRASIRLMVFWLWVWKNWNSARIFQLI